MPAITKPSNLSLTWASGGDVLDPGDTKYASGWAVEIPPRQWFNYLDNRQDTAIAHINQRGIAEWDALTEYQTNKSYVQHPTTGVLYVCILTHTNQPVTNNTYWKVAFTPADEAYTKAETDARYLQRSNNLSDVTNSATARTNIGAQATVVGAASTITANNLTASRAVVSDASGKVVVSATTSTEVGYLSGVTSDIQTQLGTKAPLVSPTLTGTPTAPTAAVGDSSTQIATTAFVVANQYLNTTRIDVASSSTVNLTTTAPNTRHINITGTTTINGFTVAAGQCYFVRFNAALTLTDGAGLVTNSGANRVTAAGDTCVIRATAANTVEILCGNFLSDAALGARGQTWQDVGGSRAASVTYTNTTGRSIVVSVYTNIVSGTISRSALLTVGGLAVARMDTGDNTDSFVSAIVPAASTYMITLVSLTIGTDVFWRELR